LKRLVEMEGLKAGHFTASTRAEELVAPDAGFLKKSEFDELDVMPKDQEAQNKREYLLTEAKELIEVGSAITEAKKRAKATPAVSHELFEQSVDDIETISHFDQLHEDTLFGLISSTPFWAGFIGSLTVCGICMSLVITCKSRGRSFSRILAGAEMVEIQEAIGHHKYP